MKSVRQRIITTAALAVSVLAMAVESRARAAEADPATPGQLPHWLVPPGDLDSVSLSIVDEKLSLSLAVEIHVQIELTEFALPAIHNDALRQLTAKKLQLYYQLLGTLDNLTDGRSTAVLAHSPRGREHVRQNTTADTGQPGGPVPAAVDARPKSQESAEAAQAPSATARAGAGRDSRRVAAKGGGIGNVLQNAATAAILRVRLEIAEQYAGLLRAEMELTPPVEFDRHYLAIEVFNQMQIVAMLRVFEHQASADFARVLHVATVAAETQMVEARGLVDVLKNISQPAPLEPMPLVNAVDRSGS